MTCQCNWFKRDEIKNKSASSDRIHYWIHFDEKSSSALYKIEKNVHLSWVVKFNNTTKWRAKDIKVVDWYYQKSSKKMLDMYV